MTSDTAYIYFDDRIVPSADARISPGDRSFRYGDGVFETIRVFAGRSYLWHKHMQRLTDGLEALGMTLETDRLQEAARQCLQANTMEHGMLRITVSRGAGGAGYLPPEAGKPLLCIEPLPLGDADSLSAPLRLCVSCWRRIPPSCLPTHCKTAQGLNSILARQEADARGCNEALQLSVAGHISCASSANLFWRVDGRLFTPSLQTGCLGGTTRERLMELAEGAVQEVEADSAELSRADAVFLTNSRYLARPVISIEGLIAEAPHSMELAESWRSRLESDAQTLDGAQDA